jgi:uncharacterized protein YndB with AHSA1/START domain
VVEDRCIVFETLRARVATTPCVAMAFMPLDNQNTMVPISEAGFREDLAEIKASCGSAGGWMHMMCSLKAYLEYGINLRGGRAC